MMSIRFFLIYCNLVKYMSHSKYLFTSFIMTLGNIQLYSLFSMWGDGPQVGNFGQEGDAT